MLDVHELAVQRPGERRAARATAEVDSPVRREDVPDPVRATARHEGVVPVGALCLEREVVGREGDRQDGQTGTERGGPADVDMDAGRRDRDGCPVCRMQRVEVVVAGPVEGQLERAAVADVTVRARRQREGLAIRAGVVGAAGGAGHRRGCRQTGEVDAAVRGIGPDRRTRAHAEGRCGQAGQCARDAGAVGQANVAAASRVAIDVGAAVEVDRRPARVERAVRAERAVLRPDQPVDLGTAADEHAVLAVDRVAADWRACRGNGASERRADPASKKQGPDKRNQDREPGSN